MRLTSRSPQLTSFLPMKLLATAPTQQDGQRQQHAEAGDVEADQAVRLPGLGQDQQRAVQRADDPLQHGDA